MRYVGHIKFAVIILRLQQCLLYSKGLCTTFEYMYDIDLLRMIK